MSQHVKVQEDKKNHLKVVSAQKNERKTQQELKRKLHSTILTQTAVR